MTLLPLLHFNGVAFLLTLAVFIVLLIILSKTAWGPILKALDDRDDKIRGDLDEAEKARAESERVLEQHRQELAKLKADIHKIREETRALADQERDNLLLAAREEASKHIEMARTDLERERRQAIESLKATAVEVGIGLARKLLQRELDAKSHRDIVASSITELDQLYSKAG